MKRVLKFRIWDKKEKKYFEPIYEAYKGNLLDLSISMSGELLRRSLDCCSEHESKFPNRFLIEQFIGLKDKNGVEIYEGDIMKSQGSNLIVVYQASSFVMKIKAHHKTWFTFILSPDEPQYEEVIGNIHQYKAL